jgi:molybdopterin-binding protein
MSEYRIGQVAELLEVSADTVRRWADEGRLATRRTEGGHRLVDGADLARFLTEQADVPGTELVAARSARNRFTGIVTRVVRDTVAAQVELQAGRHRIVSLLTREAADELGLEPGVLATASVKATSVVIELPAP